MRVDDDGFVLTADDIRALCEGVCPGCSRRLDVRDLEVGGITAPAGVCDPCGMAARVSSLGDDQVYVSVSKNLSGGRAWEIELPEGVGVHSVEIGPARDFAPDPPREDRRFA